MLIDSTMILCVPELNCEIRKWIVLGDTRLGIFAKRDISVGGAPVHCLCGATNCSLFLGAKSQGYKVTYVSCRLLYLECPL